MSVSPHWSPVEASWIVSIGLVIVAVLPHQIPSVGRYILTHPLGWFGFAGMSAYVFWLKPLVGMAMFILLAGISFELFRSIIMRQPLVAVEAFAPLNLNNDKIGKTGKTRHLWLEEEILSEIPEGIQTLTEESNLTFDSVAPNNRGTRWFVETQLNERPVAIQDRRVATDVDGE